MRICHQVQSLTHLFECKRVFKFFFVTTIPLGLSLVAIFAVRAISKEELNFTLKGWQAGKVLKEINTILSLEVDIVHVRQLFLKTNWYIIAKRFP